MILQILLGLAAGMALPVQTCMNNGLKKRLGSPFRSVCVSFSTAGGILLLILLLGGQFPFSVEALKSEPFWIWCGGFFGAVFVTGNVLLFSRLGSVQAVILPVSGQIFMSLIIDHFGLFFYERRLLGAARIVGALLILAGMIFVALGKVQGASGGKAAPDTRTGGARLMIWRVFGVLAGMASAVQTAINGRAGRLLGSPFKGAMISMITSASVLLAICIVQAILKKGIAPREGGPLSVRRIWIWLGGAAGCLFLTSNTYLAGIFGNGITLTLILLGSVCASAVIDHFALLGAQRARLNGKRLLGLALLFAGAALIRLL